MRTTSSAVAIAALALALSTPVLTQSPLCTFPLPWASNNGGTAGGIVFYDLAVNAGVLVNSFDCNCSGTTGSSVTLEVYTTPGTHVGNETNAGVWTLVASAGPVLSAARNSATTFTLASPLILNPGNYGIGFRVVGSGQAYTGTGTGGTPTVVSTAEMTLTAGSAISALFTGSFFSIRAWNGCIHYTPAAGLWPSFSGTPTSGASPLNVQFTDTTFTSDPNGVLSWVWDFENDGTPDAFVQNPLHAYMSPGLYSVRLTATDALHGSQSFTRTNYISVDPITANFTATPTIGAAPLLVNFTDTSLGLVTAWAWDFENDGITDSTQQNPAWLYATAGQYTVKLTASNSGQSDVELKTNLVFVTGQPVEPGTPDRLQYQFNEPRGTAVANTATGVNYPASGTAGNATWQRDPGRNLFNPNDAGIGCLSYHLTNLNSVDTGARAIHAGSMTISFWARRDPASTIASPFGYFFSDGTSRCFMGSAGILFVPGGTAGTGSTTWNFTGHLVQGVWNHYAIVIDDAAGTVSCWENGIPHATLRTFTPNTYSYPGTTNNLRVGAVPAGTSRATLHYDMDDFRIYGRALNNVEILGALQHERPASSTFGLGCAGPGGVPVIATSGGVPQLGNGAFQIDVSNTEVGAPCAVTIGIFAIQGGLPLDLSFLLGPGCVAENLPDLAAFVVGLGPSGSLPLGLPLDPNLAGAHLYAQAIVFGTQGAASKGLAINLQN
ncbi:MAG: PKD domain-containing protein [Planctomycetes bacterium]|nr:PKD domain-containing protein [Planctomycetota bacterium]